MMRSPRTIFLLVLCALTALAKAQSPPPPVLGESPFPIEHEHIAFEKIGQWPGYVRGGLLREIASDGERLYIAARNGGQQAFDLSDPMAPEPISGFRILRGASDVTAEDGFLYTLNGEQFEIFDISTTDPPAYLSGIMPDVSVLSLSDFAAADRFIYFGIHDGMRVLDTNDLSSPTTEPVPTTPLHDDEFAVTTIYREGNLLLGSSSDEVRIFDLTVPAAPELVWGDQPGVLGRGISDIDGLGDQIVLASNTGLIFASVANPTFPQVRAVAASSVVFQAVAMSETRAVGLTEDKIHVFDISDFGAPVSLGVATSPEPLWEVTIVGDHAYATAGSGELLAIDLNDAIPAVPTTVFSDRGRTTHIEIFEEHAYVVDEGRGLFVLDISVPSAPVELAQISIPPATVPAGTVLTDLQASGDRLYVGAGAEGTLIFDIGTDPAVPEWLGYTDVVGEFKAIGNRLYVARAEREIAGMPRIQAALVILDTTIPNPADVIELGSFPFESADFKGIDVVDLIAYIAGGAKGIYVFEVNDPTRISLKGIIPIPVIKDGGFPRSEATGIHAVGSLMFVEERDGVAGPSVEFFDLSSHPAGPLHPLSHYRLNICCGVEISGTLAFIGSLDFGLHALDTRGPEYYPVSVGGYDTFGTVHEIQVIDDLVYVANGAGGLVILETGPFEAETSNPRFDDAGDFLIDVRAPHRNLFRVRNSTDLESWEVANATSFFERHFTGTGQTFTLSSEHGPNMELGPRHFFHIRGGPGLVLDPSYFSQ